LLACVPAGAEVLCLRSGRFGEKWAGLCRRFGFAVTELEADYGQEYDLDRLRVELAARPGTAAVVVVHSETSTGMLHDVAAVARAARAAAPDALVIVDAVSSLAAAQLRPRDWDLDAATSLVAALDVALDLVLEAGLEARWREKERLNRALLAAGEACGLRRFASRPSPALAALEVPAHVGAARLAAALAELGLHVGGGQ